MALVTTADILTATKNTAAAAANPELLAQFDMLRRQMEKVIKRWCNWGIESNDGIARGSFLEYYDGKNYCDVILRKPWAARVSDVRLNQLGSYGSNNQFAGTTALTNGTDYSLVFEQTGKCASGMLRRIGANSLLQGWWPSNMVYNRGAGGMSFAKGPVWPSGNGNVRVTYDWGFQPATTISAATWTAGVATFTFASPGIVARPTDEFVVSGASPSGWNGDWQVASVSSNGLTITANMASDPGSLTTAGSATFIPLDIQSAVCEAVTIQRAMMQFGGRLNNEGLGDYSYGLHFDQKPDFGSVKQMLSPWRDVSQGISLV